METCESGHNYLKYAENDPTSYSFFVWSRVMAK